MIQDQEPDSLWNLNEDADRLVLVNEDEYIFEPFYESDERFYEVPEPQ